MKIAKLRVTVRTRAVALTKIHATVNSSNYHSMLVFFLVCLLARQNGYSYQKKGAGNHSNTHTCLFAITVRAFVGQRRECIRLSGGNSENYTRCGKGFRDNCHKPLRSTNDIQHNRCVIVLTVNGVDGQNMVTCILVNPNSINAAQS